MDSRDTKRTKLVSRRVLLSTLVGGAVNSFLARRVSAASDIQEQATHGLSTFGDLRYPTDFRYLNYVNPNAPKGGVFSTAAGAGLGGASFDSLNAFILRGNPAVGIEATFASLMARAYDEPDSLYAFAAAGVLVSSDRTRFRFVLRDGLTFHDGSSISAADVAFSLRILKELGHPILRGRLREIEEIVAEDLRIIAITLARKSSIDTLLLAASLPIFSQRYYAQRSFDETTLNPPIGSGAYRIGKFEPGRFIEYERVKDWWGTHLPICRGTNNFDLVRYEYFRDREASFQAFIAGAHRFREELNSRTWATRYDIPATQEGRVRQAVLPDGRPSGGPGWAFNTRREYLKDRRVREAIILALDFEWINKNIMFDSYKRSQSYFENSEMTARGRPSPEESAVLDPFRGQLSSEVFDDVWSAPTSDGSGQDRRLLARSAELLDKAGWALKNGVRTSPDGQRLKIELLYIESSFEPHQAIFSKNLSYLGIELVQRRVDPAQYHQRLIDYDFDITLQRTPSDPTPGSALRGYFTSQAARSRGEFNYAGISDPVVDALVGQIESAETRVSLVTTCRALDRVLRNGLYWIPLWYKPGYWLAYWDVFGRPDEPPKFRRGAPENWWYNADQPGRTTRPSERKS